MAKTIKVMAAKVDDRTVLWETDPAHVTDANPTGEIFIAANGTAVEVGESATVKKFIENGTLVKVTGADAKAKAEEDAKAKVAEEKAAKDLEARAKADAKAADTKAMHDAEAKAAAKGKA